MNSCDFDFCEIGRSVDILPDQVVKVIRYSGDPGKIQSALEESKRVFFGVPNCGKVTTVQSLEVKDNCLVIEQARVESKSFIDPNQFTRFAEGVMQANLSGWVFGDLNYKNVIFDGTRFKVIDFEPFTKIIRNTDIEYRVTPPYFHPLDKARNTVTSLTDRLGLIGLHLRLRFGLRKQKEIFSLHASSLHGLAVTEGASFIKNLQQMEERYA